MQLTCPSECGCAAACSCSGGLCDNPCSGFTCSTAGPKRFTVAPNGVSGTPDAFYITLVTQPACYDWYFVTAPSLAGSSAAADSTFELPPDNGTYAIRAWIFDYYGSSGAASADERAAAAFLPSPMSARLTSELATLGEFPRIVWADSTATLQVARNFTWVPSGSYWEGALYSGSSAGLFALTVSGARVSAMNCYAGPTGYEIYVRAASPAAFPAAGGSPAAGSPGPARMRVKADPCAPNVALALFDEAGGPGVRPAALLTQSAFLRAAAVALPASDAGGSVTDALVTDGGALAAGPAGLLRSDKGAAPWSQVLPASAGVDRVEAATAQTCDVLRTPEGLRPPLSTAVLAWPSSGAGAPHFSSDSGRSFSALPAFPSSPAPSSVPALVRPVGLPRFTALLRYPDAEQLFWLDAVRGTAWTAGHRFEGAARLAAKAAARPGVVSARDGTSELLVYGDALYYSADGGASAYRVALPSRADPAAELAPDEVLEAVATGAGHWWAALTSTGRLYLGALGLSDAMELASGEAAAPGYRALRFDGSGGLWILSHSAAAGPAAVALRAVPHGNERGSPRAPEAVNPEARCGYMDAVAHADATIFYLDMGENFTAALQLTPRPGGSNAIGFAVSDNSRLDLSVQLVEEPVGEISRATALATLFEANVSRYASYGERQLLATGPADARLFPASASLACEDWLSSARVRIGCPPGRSIRVLNKVTDPSQCPAYAPPAGEHGKEIQLSPSLRGYYNFTRLGCPFRVYHGTAGFLPGFLRYDNGALTGSVNSDFIVWETTGRLEHQYNATDGDAGCLRGSQQWADLLAARKPGQSLDELRTPYNHQSCFVSDPKGAPLQRSYEIMNSTGFNTLLIAPSARDGVLLMKARIIEPTYSYCDLTAEFAIEVYGAPLEAATALLILGVTMAAILAALVASYFYYRRKKLHIH
eukprot:tig00020927_g15965.t1